MQGGGTQKPIGIHKKGAKDELEVKVALNTF
jgi:hypothetical protein